ncbi:uncharacterized protein LOC127135881 [Lathyrus oleraceus]|uniref:uncharacterized protein LOC127135881 n=1 Tax=Pisum sativum TaxID=3888 RepID=UPI0021CF96C5|nr:uncharacterized protein LOC127135881 [Pisum sativum]
MAGLQNNTSIYTQPHNTVVSPIQNFGSGMNHVGRNTQSQGLSTLLPTLTTNNQAAFRQQMDASNHDMVGVLAREMNTVFSPLIQNEEEPTINQVRPPRQAPDERVIWARLEQQPVRQEVPEEQPRRVMMVNRDQDVDEVIHRVRQENMMENNLTTMIERIMAQNGLNTGLRRPNYTFPLSEYVLQTELPRGCKIPKFTKFSGDTSESTIEHIVRYMTEAGDLANSENLRMKYFPNSLTRNAFTWFTTLPPNSIDTWPHLERLFHEQFYMGQTKISLKELASIKRKFIEPIDDYLNRFRLLKSRCFTVVDMAQLADRVRQVERLKAEKAKANKNYKKERVAYVEVEDEESEISNDPYGLEEFEVDLAELKEAPPYACKLLTPSNGRNPFETEKNDRFPKKTYTFDVTKYDEIFDLLVKDGQMIKRGFCKYHNFLGHKTSQCFLFRDLIQNAIKDDRLKFADRGRNQMKVDADPLNIANTNYVEPVEINMIDMVEVEAVKETGTEGYVLVGKQATDDLNNDVPFRIFVEGEQVADVEPKATEGLNGKATEGLRKKFEENSIADGANLGVNMVDLNQPPPPPPRDGGSGEVSENRARGNAVWLSQSQ